MKRMFGMDTETPLGKLGVIATDQEAIEATTFNEVADFLLKHRYQGSILWTFNLQYDIEHILKSTGDKELLQNIYDYGVQRPGIEYNDCHIQYIPRKLFKLSRNKHAVTVYDIAQFYNGASLEKASQQYLGTSKLPDVSGERIGEEEGYYETHKPEVLAYCQRDAKLTLELAKIIQKTFTEQGVSFKNPISQAKIAEMYIRDHYKYPKIPKSIEEMHEWAHKSYHGGLFWTLQRGYFREPVYSFDINSAYPSVMSTLDHWGNGKFKWCDAPSPPDPLDVVDRSPSDGVSSRIDKRTIMQDNSKNSERIYGWYAAEFDCPWIPADDYGDAYVIDICFRDEPEQILVNPKRKIYPTGTRRQVITKAEYDWMKKHNFKCNFITGLEWKRDSDKYVSPFAWMPKIYKKRQEVKATDKTGMLQYALKILLNGVYGKTAQSKKGEGRLTNFFYASYITAETRLKVADVALQHLGDVIEIATDSVTLTKDISAEIPISKELGEWGKDEYAEGLFIGSGMRQEWRNLGGEFVTYARGLTDKRDFDMIAFITKNRGSVEAWFTRKRPIHLGEMLLHHKVLDFQDLGVFMSVRKRLNVNTDKKSIWPREYENFGDFLDSEPMGGKPLEVKKNEKA